MGPRTALARAIASTESVVKTISSEHFALATPCAEWDVHDVLNHVIGTLWLADALLGDTKPRHPVAPGAVPPIDLVGRKPIDAFQKSAKAAQAAADRKGAIEKIHSTPLGDMPGVALAGFTTLDVLVHGWDLSRALGDDIELDEDITAYVQAFANQAITDATREPTIGPAVKPRRGATPTQKLMAYLGRKP